MLSQEASSTAIVSEEQLTSIEMDGSFSFLNNNESSFALEGQIQGRIARLNGQMARIYFVRNYVNADGVTAVESVCTPPDIDVKDMTLKEAAPMIPPNSNILLMWTSDYEIHYKGRLLVHLKMQRQYSCRLTPVRGETAGV
jgi:hypothetical protein